MSSTLHRGGDADQWREQASEERMIRFSESPGIWLEMGLAVQEEDAPASRGDAYVTVAAQSHGFVGHNDLWVDGEDLHRFCASLIELERKRQGEAVLQAIAPGELDLHIFSTDHLGHMGVQCATGYEIEGFPHLVHLGFTFDPAQLVEATRVDWVLRNAGLSPG